MSATIQYIIVFFVLTLIIVWIIYKLLKKDKGNGCACGNCTLSKDCNLKTLKDSVKKNDNLCQ